MTARQARAPPIPACVARPPPSMPTGSTSRRRTTTAYGSATCVHSARPRKSGSRGGLSRKSLRRLDGASLHCSIKHTELNQVAGCEAKNRGISIKFNTHKLSVSRTTFAKTVNGENASQSHETRLRSSLDSHVTPTRLKLSGTTTRHELRPRQVHRTVTALSARRGLRRQPLDSAHTSHAPHRTSL